MVQEDEYEECVSADWSGYGRSGSLRISVGGFVFVGRRLAFASREGPGWGGGVFSEAMEDA